MSRSTIDSRNAAFLSRNAALIASLLVSVSISALPSSAEEAAAPGADPKSARGADISHYQGVIPWTDLTDLPVHYVFIKASGGVDFVDPQFQNNWHGARQAGYLRGAYHFFYAHDPVVPQTTNFINTVGEILPHDLPPVLDLEILDHTDPAALRQKALSWLQIVEEHYKRVPIVYTGATFAHKVLDEPQFSRYPLWIAEYGVTEPKIPKSWSESGWAIWQHTQSGSLPGFKTPVDLNVFKGTPEALLEAFGSKSP